MFDTANRIGILRFIGLPAACILPSAFEGAALSTALATCWRGARNACRCQRFLRQVEHDNRILEDSLKESFKKLAKQGPMHICVNSFHHSSLQSYGSSSFLCEPFFHSFKSSCFHAFGADGRSQSREPPFPRGSLAERAKGTQFKDEISGSDADSAGLTVSRCARLCTRVCMCMRVCVCCEGSIFSK